MWCPGGAGPGPAAAEVAPGLAAAMEAEIAMNLTPRVLANGKKGSGRKSAAAAALPSPLAAHLAAPGGGGSKGLCGENRSEAGGSRPQGRSRP